jgi:hypothetical protein
MKDELEQRLRRDLSALDRVSIGDGRAVEHASRAAADRLVRRRRRALAGVTAALVGVGGVGVWAIGAGRDEVATTDTAAGTAEPASPSTTAPPTSTTVPPTSLAVDGWRPISADPRGGVMDSAVVWTGSEAIVVGGRNADGAPVLTAAAYTPATDTWARIADPPGAADSPGRIDTISVWTGREMLVLGGDLPDRSVLVSYGHAYDPTADAWRVTATPPGFINSRSPWVWTGTELFVWPWDAGGSTMEITPLAYDPAIDEWRELPEPPVQRRQRAASVWTGNEWLIWGGSDDGTDLDDGTAYNPSTNSWRVLAASPLSARRVRAAWTGVEMIVAAGSSGGDRITGNGELAHADGAAYDPATDTWRPIAAGPAHPGFEPAWTGDQLLMFAKGGVVLYDPASDRWIDDCCGDSESTIAASPVWTGTEALLIGSTEPDVGGVTFTPPETSEPAS